MACARPPVVMASTAMASAAPVSLRVPVGPSTRPMLMRSMCASSASHRHTFLRPALRPHTNAKAPFLLPRLARASSHSPMSASTSTRKPVTIQTLAAMYRKKEPIAMLTAHDFPSAHAADLAGMDIVLVGDSLAMVAMGMDDTSEVTVEEMLMHCRSVSRGARSAFVVGDMPMGSYEVSPEQAARTAIQFVKYGRARAVKMEGGAEMAPTIARVTSVGVPVMGHVGLTPQRQNSLGGFRVQGKTAVSAMKILEDARAVEAAGAFAVVLEAVPQPIAKLITDKLSIPTIGIGAGNGCAGQVLVYVDMSGYHPPGRFLPKFVKRYGDVWSEATKAIGQYRDEVKSREYPAPEYTYPVLEEEVKQFEQLLKQEETM